MTIGPELLRDEAVRRIRSARPDLARGLDLSTASGLIAAQQEIAARAEATQVIAVAVVRGFDLVPWIRGTCAYAAGLLPEEVAAWRRSFTRTIFLAGNPDNLLDRFAFAHVSEDRSAAWIPPAEETALVPLRRLLKLFDAPGPLPPHPLLTVEIPERADRPRVGRPVRHGLYLATAGVTVAGAMVHLNHLLAEAVLDGLLAPGDALTVRQVPRLTGVSEPFEALRIAGEEGRPDRLRAFAGLTKETSLD